MDALLNEDWTAEVVGRMHRCRISNLQLAEECGYSAAYLSTVLNGNNDIKNRKNSYQSCISEHKYRIKVVHEILGPQICEKNNPHHRHRDKVKTVHAAVPLINVIVLEIRLFHNTYILLKINLIYYITICRIIPYEKLILRIYFVRIYGTGDAIWKKYYSLT